MHGHTHTQINISDIFAKFSETRAHNSIVDYFKVCCVASRPFCVTVTISHDVNGKTTKIVEKLISSAGNYYPFTSLLLDVLSFVRNER